MLQAIINRVIAAWCSFGAISITLPSATYAGNQVGNGGVAVNCDGQESHPTLLDYYEAINTWRVVIDIQNNSIDPIAKAKIFLSRLATLDPKRAFVYQGEVDQFMANALVLSETLDLPPSDDYGEVSMDKQHCRLVQVALQRPPILPVDRYFNIAAEIWDKLDNLNKAGLILHEIIYKDALRRGHTDSLRSRYFNALVSSADLASLSADNYRSQILSLRLDEYDDTNWIERGVYRYFDQMSLNYQDGKKFCDDLEGPSNLWQIKALADIPNLAFSHIGLAAIGQDGHASQRVWVDQKGENGQVQPIVVNLSFEPSFVENIDLTTKLPVICWVTD